MATFLGRALKSSESWLTLRCSKASLICFVNRNYLIRVYSSKSTVDELLSSLNVDSSDL